MRHGSVNKVRRWKAKAVEPVGTSRRRPGVVELVMLNTDLIPTASASIPYVPYMHRLSLKSGEISEAAGMQ